MKAVTYATDAEGVGHIVLDHPDNPVNAVDEKLLRDLADAVTEAKAAAPRGIVVSSGKRAKFGGGADLRMVLERSPEDLTQGSAAIQTIFERLAALPCTVVAAINGDALAGACELALACDWRVAADVPDARVGLSEVQIGLIPAGGGTQRLPRLLGLPKALDLILGARRLSFRRAKRIGLLDEVVHPAVLDRAAVDRAVRYPKRKPEGGATPAERAATWLGPARRFALSRARARVRKETGGRYPAPLRAIEAMEIGLRDGLQAGYAAEAAFFGELTGTATTRDLVGLAMLGLHQKRAAREGLPAPRPVEHLGVVGLGFMGAGIAQAGASAGMTVRARDVDAQAVARGLATARKLTEDAARKGVFDRREAARIVARLSGTTDLSGFRHADLVIEAVFEDVTLKRRVIGELECAIGADAVIATNTSALPIHEIAAEARQRERIVGMHFFSPVHKMPLLEVVRPDAADDQAVATAVGAGQAMGKTVIVVRDGPGFYTTRVLAALMREAQLLLEEGVRIEEVDSAMTAFGWPIGPFALLDEVGLAVSAHVADTLRRAAGIEPPRIVGLLVAEKLQGKRGGAGFYRYAGKKRTPNDRVYALLGVERRPVHGDVAERCTLAFVNEAARCLDEGVLRSAAEGDLGAVLGLGFPPFLGGPFRYADENGDALRNSLRRLATAQGERFAMADCLKDGRKFLT